MKGKVYIAEDDKFLLRALTDKLQHEGFNVEAFTNGAQLIDAAREHIPDVVLSDLIMPEKDGFALLAEFATNEQLKDVPIIILSNLGQEADAKKAKEMGAVEYFVKSDAPLMAVVAKVREVIAKNSRGKQ